MFCFCLYKTGSPFCIAGVHTGEFSIALNTSASADHSTDFSNTTSCTLPVLLITNETVTTYLPVGMFLTNLSGVPIFDEIYLFHAPSTLPYVASFCVVSFSVCV